MFSKINGGTWPNANLRMQTTSLDGNGQPAILWRDYLNGSNYLQPLTNFHYGDALTDPSLNLRRGLADWGFVHAG